MRCNSISKVSAVLLCTSSLAFGQTPGILDVNGSSPTEFSWFTAGYGGWFTEALLQAVHADAFSQASRVSWPLLLNQAQTTLTVDFESRKERITANPKEREDIIQAITGQENETIDVITNSTAIGN